MSPAVGFAAPPDSISSTDEAGEEWNPPFAAPVSEGGPTDADPVSPYSPVSSSEGSGPEAANSPREGTLVPGKEAAQPQPEQAVQPDPARLVETLDARSRAVEALVAGQLDPRVDADALFRLDLSDSALGSLGSRGLAQLFARAARQAEQSSNRRARKVRPAARRRRAPLGASPTLEAAHERLFASYSEFLALPQDRRELLLAEHRARHAATLAIEAQREAERRVQIVELLDRTRALEAFLAGKLDPERDPRSLLSIDLLDPNEPGMSSRRGLAWSAPLADGSRSTPVPDDRPSEAGTATEKTSREASSTVEPTPSSMPSKAASDTRDAAEGANGTDGEEAREPSTAPAGGAESQQATPPPKVIDASPAALERAQRSLDAARRRFLALSAEEQQGLFARHERARAIAAAPPEPLEPEPVESAEAERVAEVIAEAETEARHAAREREQALEDARRARTTSMRVLAEEKARLLAVKEAQALFDGELARKSEGIAARREQTLVARRRVAAIQAAMADFEPPPEDPDALYRELVEELRVARDGLAEVVALRIARKSAVPQPGNPLEELGAELDRSEVDELHAALVERAGALRETEIATRRTVIDSRRDQVSALNRARLQLLQFTSEKLHAEVTGFGPEGIRQLEEELSIIALEIQYVLLATERPEALRGGISSRIVPIGIAVLQILGILFVFRLWRKRAPGLLESMRRHLAQRDPPTRLTHGAAAAIWYFGQVRKPLEWLLVFSLLFNWVFGYEVIPELRILWTMLAWIYSGLGFIRLANAMAIRDGRAHKRTDKLLAIRLRSLRLVGLTVVFIGMLLSFTAEVVGEGTIYGWVLRTCWALAVPILLLIVVWWRPIIFERLRREREASGFAERVLQREKGVWSFPLAIVGGVWLFARGTSRWLVMRASAFDATRRVLAYLFRREVAKKAEAETARSTARPISQEQADALQEDRDGVVIDDVAAEELDTVCEIALHSGSRLVALVGERGAGKTTFFSRLKRKIETATCLTIECEPGRADGTIAQLAERLGVDDTLAHDELIEALRERGPTVICVDDAQRIVRPTIGGLTELDHLTAFARRTDSQVTWIFAMDAAAWQFVNRARGDRVFFERVIELPQWTEEQIGELARSRVKSLGIEPSYEGLSVPRRFDESNDDEAERTRKGFNRILWDYSDGNPAVAMHFWGRSLHVVRGNDVIVRLFQEPAADVLDNLKPTIQFILRALAQLELATSEDVARCAQLPVSDAEEALRFATSQGFVEQRDGRYQIVQHWYRAVTAMLRRQHLLVI